MNTGWVRAKKSGFVSVLINWTILPHGTPAPNASRGGSYVSSKRNKDTSEYIYEASGKMISDVTIKEIVF